MLSVKRLNYSIFKSNLELFDQGIVFVAFSLNMEEILTPKHGHVYVFKVRIRSDMKLLCSEENVAIEVCS